MPRHLTSPRLYMSSTSVRRRRDAACLRCHNRKTRCDARNAQPCTNCKWFKHECIVPKRSKHPISPTTEEKTQKFVDTIAHGRSESYEIRVVEDHERSAYSGTIDANSFNDHNICHDIWTQSPKLPPYISPLPSGLFFSAVAAEAQSHGLLTEVNTDAEINDEKYRSVEQPPRQQISHSDCNATGPAIPMSDPEENNDWAHFLGGGTTASFLSSVNLMPHERALLMQLSNGSTFVDRFDDNDS
ncbi:hypothetical protein BJY01DRAFT_229551 [Aspergillus pseudoustus]|uniref:Zn(2)-C6 fungal-type domain-containing protein n=1 Tax=Aspergillus pseudoustus TaxID=1810923 RepID=A0ABR4IG95_9EURO